MADVPDVQEVGDLRSATRDEELNLHIEYPVLEYPVPGIRRTLPEDRSTRTETRVR
jgi:hypothetical protein